MGGRPGGRLGLPRPVRDLEREGRLWGAGWGRNLQRARAVESDRPGSKSGLSVYRLCSRYLISPHFSSVGC